MPLMELSCKVQQLVVMPSRVDPLTQLEGGKDLHHVNVFQMMMELAVKMLHLAMTHWKDHVLVMDTLTLMEIGKKAQRVDVDISTLPEIGLIQPKPLKVMPVVHQVDQQVEDSSIEAVTGIQAAVTAPQEVWLVRLPRLVVLLVVEVCLACLVVGESEKKKAIIMNGASGQKPPPMQQCLKALELRVKALEEKQVKLHKDLRNPEKDNSMLKEIGSSQSTPIKDISMKLETGLKAPLDKRESLSAIPMTMTVTINM